MLTDVAFLYLRRPTTLEGFFAGLLSSWWGSPLLWLALVLLAWMTSSPIVEATEKMARKLSLGDRFPHPTGRARKPGFPLATAFIFVIIGGAILWLWLLQPWDSTLLRIVRLISLGLFVQVGSLLLGGALACMHAEGTTAGAALRRMISLARSQRGHFVRSVVYTLPRWLGIAAYNWLQIAATLVLPFLVAMVVLPMYVSLLGPVDARWIRFGRAALLIAVGLVLLFFFSFLVRKGDSPLERYVGVAGGIATLWGVIIFPFIDAASRDGSQLWLSHATDVILGRPVGESSWIFTAGLVLAGSLSFLLILGSLGQLMILFPLAGGVCSFFLLRHAGGGPPFRATGGTSQAAGRSHLAAIGGALFGVGGAMAFSELSPPRGWLPLAWVGLKPVPLIVGLASGFGLLAALTAGRQELGNPGISWMPWMVLIFILLIILPLLCRLVSESLHGPSSRRALSPWLFPVGVARTWGRVAVEFCLALMAVGLGVLLGLIPWLGPILFGVFFLPTLFGAAYAVRRAFFWMPGCLMVYPVLACEMGEGARAGDVLKQTDYYCAEAPWTFLGACAAGLPLALLPSAAAALIFSLVDRGLGRGSGANWYSLLWTILGDSPGAPVSWMIVLEAGCVLGLAIVGAATALTNAYLTLRPATGQRPLQVGDAVILGRHATVNGDDNWNPEMDKYVGKRARIVAFVGQDPSGCDTVRVNLDRGRFVWRVQNLTRV
jgi:hypothetical protein